MRCIQTGVVTYLLTVSDDVLSPCCLQLAYCYSSYGTGDNRTLSVGGRERWGGGCLCHKRPQNRAILCVNCTPVPFNQLPQRHSTHCCDEFNLRDYSIMHVCKHSYSLLQKQTGLLALVLCKFCCCCCRRYEDAIHAKPTDPNYLCR